MDLVAMTELDAVNIMLSVIGESPVNTLEVTGLGDVATAQNILSEVSKSIQERGWGFNSESNYPLVVDIEGKIYTPLNALRVDTEDAEQLDVTVRGNRLYNKETHSFVFVKSVLCQITFMLDFSDIPQAARYYIAIRAARIFQSRVVGSETLEKFSAQDELDALCYLKDSDTDTADYNMFANKTSMSILTR